MLQGLFCMNYFGVGNMIYVVTMESKSKTFS